ncbi:phospholipid-translocating P-type ATPase [Hesseltinella vesiculosa]|uniref:Phospholipid-transporting ATPase n=1 Tax=Hesseltinella vesiculosa TaxID=101127 RepID=A0A1X2G3V1_9FUNG|nr:phospholipid-translocating P-type ATPase [Hesseltinella vesiculosa]
MQQRRKIYVNMVPHASFGEVDDVSDNQLQVFTGNRVRTAKYTTLSFIPKNLFEQFRNVANLYFLFLVVLQCIPLFGVTEPAVSAMPLMAILLITAIKDGAEDFKRNQQDQRVNQAKTLTLSHWHNVNVPPEPTGLLYTYHVVMGFFSMLAGLDNRYAHVYRLSHEDGSVEPCVATDTTKKRKKGYRPGTIPHSVLYRTASSNKRQPPVGWQIIEWQDAKVGDYVLLRSDEDVPADVLILSTSEKDSICCVETKNLDGETNLKVRQGLTATKDLQNVHDCERARFYVECEPPHPNIYQFNGVIRWHIDPAHQKQVRTSYAREDQPRHSTSSADPASPTTTRRISNTSSVASSSSDTSMPSVSHQKTEALTHNNMLLRGCVLRNTEWVIGLVVYTGDDTKIMLNSGRTPSKRSRISKKTNPHVIANFMILAGLCVVTAIISSVYFNVGGSSRHFDFGIEGNSATWLGFVTFWVALILYQNIVPISLYISVEIVKTFAAYFIYQDIDMYYEPTDQTCLARTWNISDDLGQIEYIFSDKTGTLTQNVMEFRKCTIDGVAYGLGDTEATRGAHLRDSAYHEPPDDNDTDSGRLPDEKTPDEKATLPKGYSDEDWDRLTTKMFDLQAKLFRNPHLNKHPTFVDPALFEDLAKKDDHATAIIHFFSTLALCHTALVDQPDKDHPQVIDYKAQSPDEAALVATARDMGFTFLEREADLMMLNIMGESKVFELLNVLEFNSTRKRMSVILRPRDGTRRILLLCKGADSVIYERLCSDFGAQKDLEGKQQHVRQATADDLERFAQEGLRTLCLSYRFIAEDEYDEWNRRFVEANASIYGREEKLDQVCEEIENDMLLMGGTAIEDRLQDGVPDTIAQLATSGIKLWVLTGDKTETAINIGYACNLITNDMEMIVIQTSDRDETLQQLNDALQNIESSATSASQDLPRAREVKRALVIDGKTLQYALEPVNKRLLLRLGTHCASVICCRVSPKQKAQIVSLVKRGLGVMTLAVGDGANDVSMIQEANVGVGISGVEGRQAVMASDYAIAQFCFLEKLLLIHGRWSYLRTAEMTIAFFFKNIVWTFVLFWYQIFCQFTGTMMFDYALVTLYNLIFTSLPVIALGIWDQDLSSKVSKLYPELYRMGLRDDKFKPRRFWMTVIDAIFQSTVCFFFPYMLLLEGTQDRHGYMQSGMYEIGTIIASIAVFDANFFVAFCLYSYTWIQLVVIILSIASFYVFTCIYSLFLQFDFRGQVILYSTGSYWLTLILTVTACFLPRIACKYYGHQYRPYDNDIVREQELVLNNGRSSRPETDDKTALHDTLISSATST